MPAAYVAIAADVAALRCSRICTKLTKRILIIGYMTPHSLNTNAQSLYLLYHHAEHTQALVDWHCKLICYACVRAFVLHIMMEP